MLFFSFLFLKRNNRWNKALFFLNGIRFYRLDIWLIWNIVGKKLCLSSFWWQRLSATKKSNIRLFLVYKRLQRIASGTFSWIYWVIKFLFPDQHLTFFNKFLTSFLFMSVDIVEIVSFLFLCSNKTFFVDVFHCNWGNKCHKNWGGDSIFSAI